MSIIDNSIEYLYTYIIYDTNSPIYIYNNKTDAYTLFRRLLDTENSIYHKMGVEKLHISPTYTMHVLVSTKNGTCIENSLLTYNPVTKVYSNLPSNELHNMRSMNQNTQNNNTMYMNTHDNKKKIIKQSNYDMQRELTKLTNILDNIKSTSNSDDVEQLYKNIKEEVKLDEDIAKNIALLDDTLKNELIDEDSEKISSGSDLSDTDHDKNMEFYNNLIETKKSLQNDINEKEKIVNKANELLNEDLFEKRCNDLLERKKNERYNENLEIFKSDKNTYMTMKYKIKNNIMDESNISYLFKQKYLILNFLDSNELINFSDNSDIELEYGFFEQLLKVIESYEYANESHDSDSSNDPIDDIDMEFKPLCEDFMSFLDNKEENIISTQRVHSILNDNPDIKEKLFGKNGIDVFTVDCDNSCDKSFE